MKINGACAPGLDPRRSRTREIKILKFAPRVRRDREAFRRYRLANAGLSEFNAPSFTAPPLVYGNWDSLFPMVYPNSAAPAGSDMPLVRTEVIEKSYEGYVQLDYRSAIGDLPLSGNIGVRVVHTKTTSSGYQSPDGMNFTPVSIDNEYTDALPSLNATLHLTDTQQLRFGASIAISRPPLDALVTGFSLNLTGNSPTGGGGNPKLDPFKADQIDFSYEWYFHEESLLAIAPYYKDIKTYIGASQSTENIGGTQYIITSEGNTKGGEIAGVEFTFQTRFFFLPGFLQDLAFTRTMPRSNRIFMKPRQSAILIRWSVSRGPHPRAICSTTRPALSRALQ